MKAALAKRRSVIFNYQRLTYHLPISFNIETGLEDITVYVYLKQNIIFVIASLNVGVLFSIISV